MYSSDAGIVELRQALAASLAALNGSVNPDTEIIITAGGNQAFQLALTTLIDPGDEVVLVSPCFLNRDGSAVRRGRASRGSNCSSAFVPADLGRHCPSHLYPDSSRGLDVAQQSDRSNRVAAGARAYCRGVSRA